MAFFYFGKSRVFLPSIIGSFIAVLAIVMFVVASGNMFDSWDSVRNYPDCLASIGTETDEVAMLKYLDCKDSLHNITGLQLRPDQARITTRQFTIVLLKPVGELLFWAAAFLVGLFLYRTRIVRVAPEKGKKKKKN